jgi:hypothetical protein
MMNDKVSEEVRELVYSDYNNNKNWIKKGFNKEINEIRTNKVKNLFLFLALIGIPQLINLFFPLNLRVIGIVYLFGALILFYKTHRRIE